jgi:hypothetical protein
VAQKVLKPRVLEVLVKPTLQGLIYVLVACGVIVAVTGAAPDPFRARVQIVIGGLVASAYLWVIERRARPDTLSVDADKASGRSSQLSN